MSASACNLAVDLSGLSGGPAPDDARAPDGSVEAGQPSDGGVASEGGFCATNATATFCDDFDTPPLGKRWSLVSGDPDLSLSTLDPRSPPNALRVVLNQTSTPHLTRDLPAAQRVHVEADLRVDSANQPGDVDLIDLELTPAPTGLRHFALGLVRYLDDWVLEMDVNEDDAVYWKLGGTFTSWRHFALDVDLDGGNTTVTVDGKMVLTQAIPKSKSNGAQLRVGTPYVDAATPWVVDFDNVVVANR